MISLSLATLIALMTTFCFFMSQIEEPMAEQLQVSYPIRPFVIGGYGLALVLAASHWVFSFTLSW